MKVFILLFLSFQAFGGDLCPESKLVSKLEEARGLEADFCTILKKVYPELKSSEITLKDLNDNYVNLKSYFTPKRLFGNKSGYVIKANAQRLMKAYERISPSALQAIIAHEFAHTYTYSLFNMSQNITLVNILLNTEKNDAFERFTDLLTFYKGIKAGVDFAPGFKEYRNWHRTNLTPEQEEKYLKTYHQDEELDYFSDLYYSRITKKEKLATLKTKMLEKLKVMKIKNTEFLNQL